MIQLKKGSSTISAVQQLFNKDKDKLSPKEVDFITAYATKEQEIAERYQRKIEAIKHDFWDKFYSHSEKNVVHCVEKEMLICAVLMKCGKILNIL